MSIEVIKNVIENFAPLEKAESWDNTGILIGDVECKNSSKRVLLTIDLTETIVEEAISLNASHIVTYHPCIFQPIKRIDNKIFLNLISRGISVYSPHTQLDHLINAHMLHLIGEAPGDLFRVISKVKEITGLQKIRIVRSRMNDPFYKNDGDIIAGAGAAFRSPKHSNCLLITGEMSHHDLLTCKRNNVDVIMLEHSNSERFFLSELKSLMERDPEMKDYEIFISKEDKDPVEIV